MLSVPGFNVAIGVHVGLAEVTDQQVKVEDPLHWLQQAFDATDARALLRLCRVCKQIFDEQEVLC